jgi:hypothetical protein
VSTELLVILVVPAAIAVPHLVPLHRGAPRTAAAAWLSALALRALASIAIALFLFVYVPQTTLFETVARLCLHDVLPSAALELGLSGHAMADVALTVPALTLAGSAIWLLFGTARAAMAVSRHVRRVAMGPGPSGSTVVRDDHVLVALTGIGRAQLVVSDAALAALDREELSASLAHEVGHMRRGHRPLLVLGSVLARLGRPLPGTRVAERALAFHLERDADEYAVRETRDPLALAGAICKAANGSRLSSAATALEGRTGVRQRLEYLVDGAQRRSSRAFEGVCRLLAGGMAAAVVTLLVTIALWALANPSAVEAWNHLGAGCPH